MNNKPHYSDEPTANLNLQYSMAKYLIDLKFLYIIAGSFSVYSSVGVTIYNQNDNFFEYIGLAVVYTVSIYCIWGAIFTQHTALFKRLVNDILPTCKQQGVLYFIEHLKSVKNSQML